MRAQLAVTRALPIDEVILGLPPPIEPPIENVIFLV